LEKKQKKGDKMTKEEQQLHLNNIANGIAAIQNEASGLTYTQFVKEEQVKEAVYANLQMVGEAAYELARSTDDMVGLSFDTDLLAGFRNARYNQEAEVGHQSVWNIIRDDLDEIRTEALRASARLGSEEEDQTQL
jgi:uncharacterized protein with HEPN domain